ncbi:hypothetical protein BLD25_04980 [Candidatus Gracilibacteria bacterium GN02-872]|nr:hypothetical protein BLD25_04980 [Candidatus Gracilibacteria bacterium GN02-872]
MNYFGFQLGREWKLSIAEILAIFPDSEILFSGSSVLILGNILKEDISTNFSKIGGTIKIFELDFFANIEDIYESILETALNTEGKFKYSLNLFGDKSLKLENILKKTKNLLKNKSISARYFNKDDGKNLSSAQILGNSILKKGLDFNIINLGNIFYFGKTLEVQDIDAYSKRDFSKNRDMQVGMLPPKLCQMMINIGKESKDCESKNVYDPFVGLGTVLIEALNMGIPQVFGSDLSEKMVDESRKNISDFISKNLLKNISFKIEKLNAKFINESEILQKEKIDLIVTEGYLGEIMTKKNISLDRINKQKESLLSIYSKFFENLAKVDFPGRIVICFPFWELNGKFIYFNEILEILNKFCVIENIFKNSEINLSSKSGSLLYKREKQLVGREIFKLKIKKI